MARSEPLAVAVIGCGNISRGYAQTMGVQDGKVRLVGAFDVQHDRAEAFAREFGGRAYGGLDDLLCDPHVQAVVNLTFQQTHAEVTRRCLEAGKHVHSEKPLALTPAEASDLVALAQRKAVRLSVAPSTFLGKSQQTAWQAIRHGRLGGVRIVYAEMNHGRIESWHPAPEPFYTVGPLFDVGVYPLTLLTAFLGPITQVSGFAEILWPERRDQADKPFRVAAPDWVCGVLKFESGIIGRLTTSFYVGPTKQQGLEFHGDKASLYVASSVESDAAVQFRPFGEWTWTDVPPAHPPYAGIEWGRGVSELADALREDRPHQVTGQQGAHVVEVICGILKTAEIGTPVTITSRFRQPPPTGWAI